MVHAPLHPWSGDSVSLYECAVAIFIAIFSLIRLLTSLLLFSIDRSLIIRCIVCQKRVYAAHLLALVRVQTEIIIRSYVSFDIVQACSE